MNPQQSRWHQLVNQDNIAKHNFTTIATKFMHKIMCNKNNDGNFKFHIKHLMNSQIHNGKQKFAVTAFTLFDYSVDLNFATRWLTLLNTLRWLT